MMGIARLGAGFEANCGTGDASGDEEP